MVILEIHFSSNTIYPPWLALGADLNLQDVDSLIIGS